MALTNKLTAIANAIRSKTGETGKMTLDQMPTKIGAIETGPSIQESKTIEITSNGTTEVIPDSGYEFLTRVTINTNVPTSTGPNIVITELSKTETVVVLSYGVLVCDEFSAHGGNATKELMENGFEKIIFGVDIDGFVPNIPVEYNVDEAATMLFNMNKPKATSVIFRGAPGQILVNVNESTNLAIDITPEIITTITQQTIAYIRETLGSSTVGVTCHDYIHSSMPI